MCDVLSMCVMYDIYVLLCLLCVVMYVCYASVQVCMLVYDVFYYIVYAFYMRMRCMYGGMYVGVICM